MADVQLEIAIGSPGDAAWDGVAANPSLIAIMKAAYAKGAPETPRAAASGDVNAPTSNTAAVLTYTAAGASLKHVISGVYWSYSAAPTGGNLKIEDVSGTTVFSVDITAAGPGFIPFPGGKKSAAANTAMIVTLAAGGSGVTGKVDAMHWTEA